MPKTFIGVSEVEVVLNQLALHAMGQGYKSREGGKVGRWGREMGHTWCP